MAQRRHYEGTVVPESKTLTEIDQLLRRHKVNTVRWTTAVDMTRIEFSWAFEGQDLAYRIDLNIPVKDQYGSSLSERGREQERRRLLRVLLNHIKAKLVAVEEELSEMEREFLPYLIVAGGATFGDVAVLEMKQSIIEKRLPEVRLLPEKAVT